MCWLVTCKQREPSNKPATTKTENNFVKVWRDCEIFTLSWNRFGMIWYFLCKSWYINHVNQQGFFIFYFLFGNLPDMPDEHRDHNGKNQERVRCTKKNIIMHHVAEPLGVGFPKFSISYWVPFLPESWFNGKLPYFFQETYLGDIPFLTEAWVWVED